MRNLGLVVVFWLAAILPVNGLALGLGEIEVKSFLNQPLDAEIEVISARPGEIDDLLVSLASREAFSRAGLERPRHLSDLRFSVVKSESGEEAVIRVTTKAGVKEPFLNFLIEADWSKGRVLREFTILLDPPFYADQPPPVEPVARTEPAPMPEEEASVSEIVEQAGVTTTTGDGSATVGDGGAPTSEPEPIALSEDSSATMAPEPEPEPIPLPEPVSEPYAAESSQDIAFGDVLVAKGDTLWSIAGRYKDDAHSMSQVMLAFQRTNPDAFRDGNINHMKAGAILRVPGAEELDALSPQDAFAEVLVQNGLWDEYVARVTGVSPTAAMETGGASTADASDSTAAAEVVSDSGSSELSLLVPEEGASDAAGTGDAAEINELRTKLAMAEEELEASRIENRELESRISELQARLSKIEELQSMIEIEDDSLAALESQQAEGEAMESTEEPLLEVEETPLVEQVNEAVGQSEEALLEELLAEEAAAQAQEQAALQAGSGDGMLSDEGAADGMVSDEVPADGMQSGQADTEAAGDSMAEDSTAADTGEQLVPPPAPVIVTEQAPREPSIFDGILPRSVIDMIPSMPSLGGLFSDPITLGALGGIIVLFLVLLLVRRKKKATEDEPGLKTSDGEDLFAGDEEEELTPIHLAESETPDDTDIKFPSEEDLSEPPPPEEQTLTATAEVEAVDDLAATAVISAVDMPEPEAPAGTAARIPDEQDDVLNEVDVYLAYGLYDNAEELLSSSLTENPERADYRAKLLDTYFATKNGPAFIKEAEKLKSMGDVATRYWDRVQVMGYELAPENALFSEAKDSDMSAADLEISKPQEADFDLGAAEDDDTNFSTTDFNLGEEDTGGDFSDTSDFTDDNEIARTEVISPVDDLPELSDEDDTDLNRPASEAGDLDVDLPEDIGELDFSMDDDDDVSIEEAAAEAADDLGMEFELGDDDLADEDPSDFDLGEDLDSVLGVDDDASGEDAVELDLPDEGDELVEATAVISPDFDVDLDADIPDISLAEDDEDLDDDESIDLGMDDTGVMDISDAASLETGELQIATDGIDDDEDISVLDFGAEDFEEPTALADSVELDESLAMDVDMEDEEDVKTGTFAPGDFDEPTAATSSIGDLDDIDDLMLPDDVDEVSTKLDLARAFIDMGDTEGARGSLEEVLSEGSEAQKEEAQQLLNQI